MKIATAIRLLVLALTTFAAGTACADDQNRIQIIDLGTSNVLSILQNEQGFGNSVTVTLSGSLNGAGAPDNDLARGWFGSLIPGTIHQSGNDQTISLRVSGKSNLFAVSQTGASNVTSGQISGTANRAAVSQVGTGNNANFTQSGTNNSIVINQSM